eukprot:15445941-Alexandrium_andersonii.AAC.1
MALIAVVVPGNVVIVVIGDRGVPVVVVVLSLFLRQSLLWSLSLLSVFSVFVWLSLFRLLLWPPSVSVSMSMLLPSSVL